MERNKILNSDYLDLIFEGRNKSYGGYELRKNYPKRLRNAFGGILLAALLGLAGPVIAGFGNKNVVTPTGWDHGPTIISPPPKHEDKPKILPPEREVIAAAKPTFKVTPPIITKDADVREEEKPNPPPSDARIAIGLSTTTGDPSGIDPGTNKKVEGEGLVVKIVPPIFIQVEQMPRSPYNWSAYLSDHLLYPEDARQRGSEGRAVIQFVVNEDGSISDVEVVRSSGSSSLDAEAKRVVIGMPNWIPGKQQGKAVKVYFSLPISFKIE